MHIKIIPNFQCLKMFFFCKVDQHLPGQIHSRALQYVGKSNDSKYNQLSTAANS